MKKYYYLFLYLIVVVYFIHIFMSLKYNNKKCNLNGCPNINNQNELYKIYDKYKSIRDNNINLTNKIIMNSELNTFLYKGPSNIFIIRHSERNPTEELALNCNGILRSTLIPELIKQINKYGIGIDAIICPYDYETMHEQQSITLTSWLLNIPLFMYGENHDTKIAVEKVFTNPYFNGRSILFCRKHTCIQQLINDIIYIGPKVKNINNYKFINPEGNNKLPYWNYNNYNSMFYFDSNLNFKVLQIDINTCDKDENCLITYGKKQICNKNI